ncbi:MAG: HTH domain-containing protein [Oscillospiraceae bacterium]
MLRVSARLGQIFSWLMQAKEPISVDELAQRLKTSRRTVFREIENVEVVLHDYSLLIETRVGEGLVLCGPGEGRKQLETDLAANRQWYPALVWRQRGRNKTCATHLRRSCCWLVCPSIA